MYYNFENDAMSNKKSTKIKTISEFADRRFGKVNSLTTDYKKFGLLRNTEVENIFSYFRDEVSRFMRYLTKPQTKIKQTLFYSSLLFCIMFFSACENKGPDAPSLPYGWNSATKEITVSANNYNIDFLRTEVPCNIKNEATTIIITGQPILVSRSGSNSGQGKPDGPEPTAHIAVWGLSCDPWPSTAEPGGPGTDDPSYKNQSKIRHIVLRDYKGVIPDSFMFNGTTFVTWLESFKAPFATEIGVRAFSGLPNLAEVDFSNVTTIKERAFESYYRPQHSTHHRCTSLTTVAFPKATYIGAFAFDGSIITELKLCSSADITVEPNAFGTETLCEELKLYLGIKAFGKVQNNNEWEGYKFKEIKEVDANCKVK